MWLSSHSAARLGDNLGVESSNLRNCFASNTILERNENGELIIKLLSETASILIQTGSITLKITLGDRGVSPSSPRPKEKKTWGVGVVKRD